MQGKGDYLVAMDSVGAGLGEVVFYAAGSSSWMTTPAVTEGKPSDATIISIVDLIDINGEYIFKK